MWTWHSHNLNVKSKPFTEIHVQQGYLTSPFVPTEWCECLKLQLRCLRAAKISEIPSEKYAQSAGWASVGSWNLCMWDLNAISHVSQQVIGFRKANWFGNVRKPKTRYVPTAVILEALALTCCLPAAVLESFDPHVLQPAIAAGKQQPLNIFPFWKLNKTG